MAAFTHWRFRAWQGQSSAYMQLGEVTLLSSGGTDLSVGGTASASSEFGGGYLVGNAFDKNDATEWASTNVDTAPWVQYEVAAPIDVARLSVRFAFSSSYKPSSIRLEAANSGSGPWTIMALAGPPPLENTTRVYDVIQTGQTATEYRLSVSPELFAPPSFLPLSVLEHKLGLSRDYIHGGPGRVYGNVYRDAEPADIPMVRKVRLHREVDGMCLREMWSNAAGFYEFTDLDLNYAYTVIAYDYARDYRAVIADNLIPEVVS